MERLLRVASPLGLYAEEFDAATGRHLGNFPQAFSHLALIEAAGRIIVAERLEDPADDHSLRRHHHRHRRRRRHPRPAPRLVGQADPAAGARRLAAARAEQLGHHRRVRRRAVQLAGHLVRREGQGLPAAGALLRRRRHQDVRGRAVPDAPRGLRRAAPPRRDLARLADLLRGHGAVLPGGRADVRGARRPRRGSRPSRRPAGPTRTRRSPTSRASRSSPTTWPRPGCTRSTLRAG